METAKENEIQLMSAALDRVAGAVDKLIAQGRVHREENVALHVQIAGAEKKLAAAEQQVRQVSEAANAVQKKCDEMKRKCEELEHQSRLASTDTERARLAVQTRDGELHAMTSSLAESQHEVERLRAEAAGLMEERNEARRTVDAMETESGSYASLLAQRDGVIAAREEEIHQLAAQVEQGSILIAELKLTLEQNRTELAQLGETNGHNGGMPLFSQEERDMMAQRIKEIVGRLDRYLQ